MLHRRLLLFMILFGLLTAVLAFRHGAQAQELDQDISNIDSETENIGKWLRIIKSSLTPYVYRGETARFRIIVLNQSTQYEMVNIDVSDPKVDDCNREFTLIEPDDGETPYICELQNIQEAITNEIFVTGINGTTSQADSASDNARVEILDLSTTIKPDSDTFPAQVGEIEVNFTVSLNNLSSVNVELQSLSSPELGDLGSNLNNKVTNNTCPAKIGQTMGANGGSITCTFTTYVPGAADDYNFNVTAAGIADNAVDISGSGDTVVKVIKILVASLTANSKTYAPGSSVKLKVTLKNESDTTSINILSLEDSVLGDVQDYGTCLLPTNILPNSSYNCDYEQIITEDKGEQQSFILDVSAETLSSPPIQLAEQATTTVAVIEPIVYLPISFYIRENQCIYARWLETNKLYYFYQDLDNVFYKFDLTSTSDITLELNDFTPSKGQVTLFQFIGAECDFTKTNIKEIDYDGGFNTRRILEGKAQPPGTYFINVFSAGEYSETDRYSLIVKTS